MNICGIKKEEIIGMTFSTQMLGIVPVDKNGKLSNAIIWIDSRAIKEADWMMKNLLIPKFLLFLLGLH